MFNFDTGTTANRGNGDVLWRADSWIHYSSCSGMSSILMTKPTILKFIDFLKLIPNHPDGYRCETEHLLFQTDNHDEFEGRTTTNISIGSGEMVSFFNIDLTFIPALAAYLEENAEDAEDDDNG